MIGENKLFEALLDVMPFATYAVDIETYEVVYANKLMLEHMYNPQENKCWKKLFGQETKCSWCKIDKLKKEQSLYKNGKKLVSTFFNEVTDKWLQSYDELVRWPDGRIVKYSIAVDITEQKEIQANFIKTQTKLVKQTRKLHKVNEQLKYMATKDFLTGVNNRSHFFELVKEIWNKEQTSDKKIFVVMMDIDKFKNINDTYGHKTGDEVLKIFTKIVENNIDDNDIFARMGGEEFAIVIPNSNEKLVMEKLENIRKKTESIELKHEKGIVKFTVSIGAIEKKGNIGIDVLLDEADKNLYVAKTTGRNKIEFKI
jgi:diguanylate cyclase (GGDEF)-like protein